MGWAKNYITQLMKGDTIQFRPRGGSMAGKVESGQLVTVEPVVAETELEKGDIVLCSVSGSDYLHLIKGFGNGGASVQIGNNRGGINGWTPRSKVFGRCTKVEP